MRFDLEILVRIVVGTLLGSVIGYERDIHGRPAGLRTHALVALASATFMVVSTHFVYAQPYEEGDLVEADPSRIAASVVSGIGFLAGGAILRTGFTVQGLTTAAGLWLVAAIGLAAGGGMYVEAVLATTLGIAALTLLRRFEDKDGRETLRRRLTITFAARTIDLDALHARLAAAGATCALAEIEQDGESSRVTMDVTLATSDGQTRLVSALAGESEIAQWRLAPALG